MDAWDSYKKPVIAVRRAFAEVALRALEKEGLLDPTRRITPQGEEVILPVRAREDLPAVAARLEGRLTDARLEARGERRTPHQEVLARLPAAWGPHVPDKWEKLGDVVVLRIPDALRPHAREVAAAFADALAVRCVVEDTAGVGGELRAMRGALLLGDDPVTTHVENGVKYRLDASRIMFSSGNVAERARAAGIDAAGETVVDMFAGIGYFALPLALRSGAARVVALEKNPLAFRYLEENVRLNRLERVVACWLGDNRDYPHERNAHRVLMGYFPGTEAFLPKAMRLLRPEGGIVHYHDIAPAESWRAKLEGALRAHARDVRVEEARVVKSYAPGIVHAALVARVMPG